MGGGLSRLRHIVTRAQSVDKRKDVEAYLWAESDKWWCWLNVEQNRSRSCHLKDSKSFAGTGIYRPPVLCQCLSWTLLNYASWETEGPGVEAEAEVYCDEGNTRGTCNVPVEACECGGGMLSSSKSKTDILRIGAGRDTWQLPKPIHKCTAQQKSPPRIGSTRIELWDIASCFLLATGRSIKNVADREKAIRHTLDMTRHYYTITVQQL